MNTQLQSLFQQLENQREEFSSWVMNAPAAAQHQQPGPGHWSAAQVLYHLAQIDKQVVEAMETRMASGKALKPLRWKTRFRSVLLNIALKLPLKFKAPPAVRDVPDQVQVSHVITHWQEIRNRLQAFLAAFPETQVNKEVFFHPRAGMLTLTQTLRFMLEHHEHHRRQIHRLLS